MYPVHISSCEAEGYDFPMVIAGEMQLEAMTPAHCLFPICSHALENLVGILPQVVADVNHYTKILVYYFFIIPNSRIIFHILQHIHILRLAYFLLETVLN